MNTEKIKRFVIVGGLFFVCMVLLYFRAVYIEKKTQFDGIVQKITYNEKGRPLVVIKEKEYLIGLPDIDFNDKIQLGDSIIKERDSKIYKLIKHETGEIIISN